MNPVDALLLLLLVPFALRGNRRGLCRESFALAGVVLGVIAGVMLAPALAPLLLDAGVSELAAYPVALVSIMVVVSTCAGLVGVAVADSARAVLLGGIDRTGGTVIGALKGAAALGLVLLVVERTFPIPRLQEAIAASVLGPRMVELATHAMDLGREIVSAAGAG